VAEGELDTGVQGDIGGLVPGQRLDHAERALHLEGPDAGRHAVGLLQKGEAVHLTLGQGLFSGDRGALGADVLEAQLDRRLHLEAVLQVVQLSVFSRL
jgi:hypothetical protein